MTLDVYADLFDDGLDDVADSPDAAIRAGARERRNAGGGVSRTAV
jgi:hypothetical protein